MNVFVLHPQQCWCARWLVDILVVSQTKETAQLCSTVIRLLGGAGEGLYESTHETHPCVKWAIECPANVWWLLRLGDCLSFEFAYRFDKDHASAEVLSRCRAAYGALGLRVKRAEVTPTPWPQVMPVEYRRPVGNEPLDEQHPTIQAYRDYLRSAKAWLKGKPASWRNRDPPPWWAEEKTLSAEEIWEVEEW